MEDRGFRVIAGKLVNVRKEETVTFGERKLLKSEIFSSLNKVMEVGTKSKMFDIFYGLLIKSTRKAWVFKVRDDE